MSNKDEEEVGTQEQEVSSDEDQSYDDMFNSMWPSKPESDEPSSDEEEVEEEDDENVADESAGEPTPPDGLKEKDTPEDKPAKAAAPATPAASTDPYSWIDSLPEEVREQARALKREASTHHGRATAFQRRVNELQEELRRVPAPRAAEPADRKPQATASAALEHSKKLEQLKEDFPEFAEALTEVIALERQEIERKLKETLKPLEEERAQKRASDFERAVSAEAEKIFNTSETGIHWKDVVAGADFRAWLEMQPQSVRQAATVPDSYEAVSILRRYEDDYQRAVKELGLDKKGVKEIDAAISPEAARAEELKRKRKQKQVTSTAPGSKPADGGRGDVSGDYNAMFDAMWGR